MSWKPTKANKPKTVTTVAKPKQNDERRLAIQELERELARTPLLGPDDCRIGIAHPHYQRTLELRKRAIMHGLDAVRRGVLV